MKKWGVLCATRRLIHRMNELGIQKKTFVVLVDATTGQQQTVNIRSFLAVFMVWYTTGRGRSARKKN
jgi:hypothetical protein